MTLRNFAIIGAGPIRDKEPDEDKEPDRYWLALAAVEKESDTEAALRDLRCEAPNHLGLKVPWTGDAVVVRISDPGPDGSPSPWIDAGTS